MTRRCSHCSHNGHNSRTCPNRGVKLFGVRLTDGLIRKSASMGNLTHYMSGGGSSGSGTPQNGVATDSPADTPDHPSAADGYASEDFVAGSSSSRERKKGKSSPVGRIMVLSYLSSFLFHIWCIVKLGLTIIFALVWLVNLFEISCYIFPKSLYRVALYILWLKWSLNLLSGVPWTEEEHRMFLLGLQKLGKGDWRGIARNYVISRTPTQVASHAQKYFIRQCNVSRRKRRSSLFDIVADESVDTPMVSRDFFAANPQLADTQSSTPVPPAAVDEECESMESANSNDGEALLPMPEGSQYSYPVVYPAYVAPFFPLSFPFWPGYNAEPVKEETHEVLKPTPVHSKTPINVDELVGMSKLTLGESLGDGGPSNISLKLVEGSTRPSAFHANPATSSSDVNSNHNPIHAV